MGTMSDCLPIGRNVILSRLLFASGFDDALAHQIQAGSDMLLMPSRYEPCGLTQLYSLRYGTIPIVRAVGGLKDTVIPVDLATGNETGFVFTEPSAEALIEEVQHRGACFYRDKTLAASCNALCNRSFRGSNPFVSHYLDLYPSGRHAASLMLSPPLISFGTSGWRALVAEEFTHERVAVITRAVGRSCYWVRHGKHARLLIAHDTRFLGREFAETAVQTCVLPLECR